MPSIAKRFSNLDIIDVVKSSIGGVSYPGTLVIPPNIYSIAAFGGNFDMRQSGLYAIANLAPEAGYTQAGNFFIVSGNPYMMASACAWLTYWGEWDSNLTTAQLMQEARWRGLGLLCGKTIQFTQEVFKSVPQYPTRMVHIVTAETPNNYLDGHICVEIKINNHWTLFDIALKRYWSANLSLLELLEQGPTNGAPIKIARSDTSPQPYKAGASFGFHAQICKMIIDENEFTRRLFQIVGIDDGGITYWYMPPGTETRKSWLLSLSTQYAVVSRDEFIARFYS
jgi:hypothetical protein